MPIDLRTFAAPERTAVIVNEMQLNIVGPEGRIAPLAEAVKEYNTVENLARLLKAARAAGVRVVHNTIYTRPDRAGASYNTPLQAVGLRRGAPEIGPDDPRGAVLPELWDPSDINCKRIHGLTGFTGTEVDGILRNMGIKTVIVTGVSVNLGVTGTSMEASSLGYTIIIPRDATAGFPASHIDSMFQHTLPVIATITDVDSLVAAWQPVAAG